MYWAEEKSINKVKYIFLIALLLTSIGAFPMALNTVLNVIRLNMSVIANANFREFLHKIQQPFEGEYVIVKEALSMIHILRFHQVPDFRFSPGIKRLELVMQRVIEGAYPIRYRDSSHYLLMLNNERLPPGATILTVTEGVIFAYCP